MSVPLVSIIIPVYNGEDHLAETIQSALEQDWPNKEIIIVNDGSTDRSAEIARQFLGDKISLIEQPNISAAAARNRGLKEAKGEYIQFLDADDLLSPDKISAQVMALNSRTDQLAVCSTVHFKTDEDRLAGKPSAYEEKFLNSDEDPVHFYIQLNGGYTPAGSMIAQHAWLSPAALIRKAGAWNEELSVDDDGEFFTRLILASRGIIKTPGFCFYRKYHTRKNLSAQNHLAGLNSRLRSAILRKQALFQLDKTEAAKTAVYKSFLGIMVHSYVRFPEVYEKAKNELPEVEEHIHPAPFGGKIVQFLSRLMGWKIARRLQLLKMSFQTEAE